MHFAGLSKRPTVIGLFFLRPISTRSPMASILRRSDPSLSSGFHLNVEREREREGGWSSIAPSLWLVPFAVIAIGASSCRVSCRVRRPVPLPSFRRLSLGAQLNEAERIYAPFKQRSKQRKKTTHSASLALSLCLSGLTAAYFHVSTFTESGLFTSRPRR